MDYDPFDLEDGNEIVLSYYDSLLRQSDRKILLGDSWINDAIIGFYYEYLGKKQELYRSTQILYVSPELTQLLKMTDSSEFHIFLDPLNASQRNFIFFPINNCQRRDVGGGSHWSLLVFSRVEKKFFHFDSFNKTNKKISAELAKSLNKYLLGNEVGEYEDIDCPQQSNFFDCGLFVMCYTDILTEHITNNSKIVGYNFQFVSNSVQGKRNSLLRLIDLIKAAHTLD